MNSRLLALAFVLGACSPTSEHVDSRRDAFSGSTLGLGSGVEGLGARGLSRCPTNNRYVANTRTGRVWGNRFGLGTFDGPDGGADTIACTGPAGSELIIAGARTGLFSWDGNGWSQLSQSVPVALASSAGGDRLVVVLPGGKIERREGDGSFIDSFTATSATYSAVAWNAAGTHFVVLDTLNSRLVLFDWVSGSPIRNVPLPIGVPQGPTIALGNFHYTPGFEVAVSSGNGVIHLVNLSLGLVVNTLTLGGTAGAAMASSSYVATVDALWVGDPQGNVVRRMVGSSPQTIAQSTDDEDFGSSVAFAAAGAGQADGGAGVIYLLGTSLPLGDAVEMMCTEGLACPLCGDSTATCIGGVVCVGQFVCATGQTCTAAGCAFVAMDAGVADAGLVDAGPEDPSDAGVPDAGVIDAGVIDAGIIDAGIIDAGIIDAGIIDTDAGVADAGTKRDGGIDAGTLPKDAGAEEPQTVFVASGCSGCSSIGAEGLWCLCTLVLIRRRGALSARG